jgi:hypothetical protein
MTSRWLRAKWPEYCTINYTRPKHTKIWYTMRTKGPETRHGREKKSLRVDVAVLNG